jgi:maltooligosyltrehalose trehalohydrolase
MSPSIRGMARSRFGSRVAPGSRVPPDTATQDPGAGTYANIDIRQAKISTGCYAVWAPNATRVELEIDGERLPLARADGGWWASDRPLRHGDRYGYVLDGEGPFPDPRSLSQPQGVHGLSEWIDHSRFAWSDQRWQAPPLAAGLVYELHIGTFSPAGTFDGAISRLAHLVELGVTHVELMPVVEFSGARGWGYDGVDLFAPHHAYGGPDHLKRLIDACHAAGLAVILDVVYNHLGPSGNYLSRFGPYFTGRYHTPWGEAINLDAAGSDEVRRFLCDNALMWLRDYHFDGLRLDAVHALIDTSATHLLEQLSAEVDVLEGILGRHFVLIAESDLNDPRIVRPRDAGGYGIDAQWSDDFHHALHSVVTGERSGYYEDFGSLHHVATALQRVFVYGGTYSRHRNRVHGHRADGLPGSCFVVAAQNHDQVGNRAAGERLSHLASIGRVKIAAAVLLTSPFVPMLFQGEEWGASTPFQYFTAHEDATLGAQVSEGRRREFAAFGWDPENVPDPQHPETFERSRLRWQELSQPDHAEMLDWHRALIALRRERPSLRDADCARVQVAADDGAQTLVIRRGEILIACNLSSDHVSIDVAGARPVLVSDRGIEFGRGGIRLPPDSVAIAAVTGARHS